MTNTTTKTVAKVEEICQFRTARQRYGVRTVVTFADGRSVTLMAGGMSKREAIRQALRVA